MVTRENLVTRSCEWPLALGVEISLVPTLHRGGSAHRQRAKRGDRQVQGAPGFQGFRGSASLSLSGLQVALPSIEGGPNTEQQGASEFIRVKVI